MVQRKEPAKVVADKGADKGAQQGPERLAERLDMLDERLNYIDSVVTAIVERVMSQPISLNMTCPHCGKSIEVAMIGRGKPTR